MALLGLPFHQANADDVRGIAEKASTGLLLEELAGKGTLHARRFSTTEIDDHVPDAFHRFEAGGASERVVIGVVDALE